MASGSEPLEFFEQTKARSLHKLNLLEGYLQPFTFKLGSSTGWGGQTHHIWIVDGFAGAGSYQPDASGRVQDGSPVIAAKWAKKVAVDRGYPLVRCINVERDRGCFERLRRELAPWQDVAIAHNGEFADHLLDILDAVGADPALFFLDPFGIRGIEMDLICQIAARSGKTELLLHFSDKTFLRMAGHLDDRGERMPAGQKQAESKLAALDTLIGTKRWRLLVPAGADTETAIDAVAELYLEQLRESGWRYAHQIQMRDAWRDRPAYRLMFATPSPHGVELMSDLVCRYEQTLEESAVAGQMTLWHEQEERQRSTNLKDQIYAEGKRAGAITREQLIHRLAPQHFGRYTSTYYAKMIRELVNEGLIDRPTAKSIGLRESLGFVESPQGSLIDGLGLSPA